MSGQQIGSTIGLIVGSYFGGPVGGAIGSAIGGYIGGAIDPTIVKGPKIGDGQTQSSTDGQPIAWIQGTAAVAGTIVQVSTRRQIRHKDGGKGSGTVQETFTAQQDFAILICESCEVRDSSMAQVWMVYQDGKLVYDVRAGSSMLEDSYKWAANVDFLYGDEDQLPHPTLEAISGVGNTPSYRGSLVAVFKSFDVTSAGDRIPQFQFVVSSSGNAPVSTDYTDVYTYKVEDVDTSDYSSPTYDDSLWPSGHGAFGDQDHSGITMNTFVPSGLIGRTIWIRKKIPVPRSGTLTINTAADDGAWLWVNGVLYQEALVGGGEVSIDLSTLVSTIATVVLKVVDSVPSGFPTHIFSAMKISVTGAPSSAPAGEVAYQDIIRQICLRGGLNDTDFDLTNLPDHSVAGYMVAVQSDATDCLSPLLQTFFCFASDYNAKLYFHPYGDDATVTITTDNLLESPNSENDGLFTRTQRSQETEFPLRMVAQYIDPAQNYKAVQVTARRRASTVKAIGDQQFQIPVAISASDAAQAVDKALKVAYAKLQGTVEFTVPFADADCYIALPTGFPLIFESNRYTINQMTISQSSLNLTLSYDRQSSFTSNVQPILGNAPMPAASRYSGPTKLLAMNLPAQRPQDSVGVYLAAGSANGSSSWVGCNVQVSLDGQSTWQQAMQIVMESNIGTFTSAEPSGGDPLSITTLKFDLESATPAQLASGANAFAVILPDGTTQIGQFTNATEISARNFAVSTIARGLGGVPSFTIADGMDFTLMDAAYFYPIPAQWVGRSIFFRAVGFGENAGDVDIVEVVYGALTSVPGRPFTTEDGDNLTAEDGLTNLFTET
ncbi:phage tail protein [Dyella kyungheensis]|uniref:phage tail protein n=1 Tax=Dyella kyungheensis TaxID=1242174 RepID=UPI003CE8D60F